LQVGGDVIGFQLSVECCLKVHGPVVCPEGGVQQLLLQGGFQIIPGEEVGRVMQFADVSLGVETGLRGEQVRAFALYLELCRDAEDGVLGQILVHVQVVDGHVGAIGLSEGVVSGSYPCGMFRFEAFVCQCRIFRRDGQQGICSDESVGFGLV